LNATLLQNGFTQDAIILLTSLERRGDRTISDRIAGLPDAEAGEALRNETIAALSPLMRTLPPFVQQIVGRALMEEVNWPAVASRVKCPPDLN